jgi:hypothetical protein
MASEINSNQKTLRRSIYTLAFVNVGIWAISIIAMVFLMQDSPNVRMFYPILGGGTVVGIAIISTISKTK